MQPPPLNLCDEPVPDDGRKFVRRPAADAADVAAAGAFIPVRR